MSHKKIIEAKSDSFRDAWNRKDVGELSLLISKDIINIHPKIYFAGLINISGKTIEGNFALLKFWRGVFRDFDVYEDKKDILKIRKTLDGYSVECIAHFPNIKLSAFIIIDYNQDFLIKKFDMKQIMNYRDVKKISAIKLISKMIRQKIGRKSKFI